MSMQAHQQRVVAERAELDGRLEKLDLFLGTPVFAGLSEPERALLEQQSAAMGAYSDILAERIATFTP